MKLSENFSLREFTRSPTARRLALRIEPTPVQVERLASLCRAVLQPIRDRWGPVRVTSGFRSVPLNKAIGGAQYSQHMCRGPWAAADIHVESAGNLELCRWIIDQGLPYDQLLLEHFYPSLEGKHSGWVHVSSRTDDKNRGEAKQIFADEHRGRIERDGLLFEMGGG